MAGSAHDVIKRPGLLALAAEARSAVTWPSFLVQSPRLLHAPRGDQRTVILTPGFLAGDLSMKPLATYLHFLGYEAKTWGLGRNNGDVRALVDRFGEAVSAVAEKDGAPATLIGWSLGGVIARETARDFPDAVREVITMGSPIVGGPKYTSIADFYAARFGVDLNALEAEIHERNSTGLRQPVTSIYSKRDGVVAWRASIDDYNPHARNIEVRSAHFTFGLNAETWRVIADTLAGSSAPR